VSLLILPAIITQQDNDGTRLLIAAVATVVLAASVIRSSRQSATLSANL
jgi:hypothetical protein